MGKNELTQTELDNLVAATGESVDNIRKRYEEEQKIFPADGMTQAQFEKVLGLSDAKEGKVDPGKTLFDLVDRDKSGKISLYEYLLAQAAMFKENPEIVFKCLFKLCDSDHDDLLTKPELFELFNVLFDSENYEGEKKDVDKINKLVNQIFGDKEKLSENEFREAFIKDEELKAIAEDLETTMFINFILGPQLTKYGTE